MEAVNKNLPDSLAEFLEMLKSSEEINPAEYGTYVSRYLNTKAREKHVPIYGKFELTPLCNLDCKMCYVHLNKNQMDGAELLDVEAWKNIMKQAIDAGMLYAELTGGECLTYPDFDELYLYLQSYGVETVVFTNAILLDDKRIEFFKAHPPKQIQVTLYGSCEDAYERVTGHRQFDRVYGNILKAKEAGLHLSIAITPNAFIGDDGKELVKAAFDTGLSIRINYSLVDPYENTGRHGMDLDASNEQYIEMNKYLSELQGYNIVSVDENSLPDLGGKNAEKQYGISCGAGRSAFCITWKGEMFPCLNLFHTEPGYPLRDGFIASWNQVNQFSSNYLKPVECINCEYKNVCVSCAALHMQHSEAGHANPLICKRTMQMVKAGLLKLN